LSHDREEAAIPVPDSDSDADAAVEAPEVAAAEMQAATRRLREQAWKLSALTKLPLSAPRRSQTERDASLVEPPPSS
jgi:hypothetical protein